MQSCKPRKVNHRYQLSWSSSQYIELGKEWITHILICTKKKYIFFFSKNNLQYKLNTKIEIRHLKIIQYAFVQTGAL